VTHNLSVEQLDIHQDIPVGASVNIDVLPALAEATETNPHVIIRVLRLCCAFHQEMQAEIELLYGG
jgi:hypothetical protein